MGLIRAAKAVNNFDAAGSIDRAIQRKEKQANNPLNWPKWVLGGAVVVFVGCNLVRGGISGLSDDSPEDIQTPPTASALQNPQAERSEENVEAEPPPAQAAESQPQPEPQEPQQPAPQPEHPEYDVTSMSAGDFSRVVIELVEGSGAQVPSASDPCIARTADEVRQCTSDGIDRYMGGGGTLLEAGLGVACVGLARGNDGALSYVLGEPSLAQRAADDLAAGSYNAARSSCGSAMEVAVTQFPGAEFPIPSVR